MGMLVEGRWSEEDRTMQGGAYVRQTSPYGEPLPQQTVQAIADEPGRFHLIASLSCPWSHRTMIARVLKGLEDALPLHIAGGPRTEGYRVGTRKQRWTVPGDGSLIEHLHELYTIADRDYTGRTTVPVLWDSTNNKIVSNESLHILRGLDAVKLASRNRDGVAPLSWTLSPSHLANEIDVLAQRIQIEFSNAVYRAGKAQRQDVYDEAVEEVFALITMLEDRLGSTRYLHGNALTETDLRLWPTLARFDAVYHGHFKCSRHRLTDYPNVWGYARDVFGWKGVGTTFSEPAIRAAYYGEDLEINPHGVVATAPLVDWTAPHGRGRHGPALVTQENGTALEVDPVTLMAVSS